MLEVRLFALGQQEPLVNMMVNKIPRQNFVMSIAARNKKIRIGQRRIVNSFTPDGPELVPDGARIVASMIAQAFENRADAPIAAGNQSLEVSLAW